MHELGVVFYIIDAVKKVAIENEAKKVKSITLEVGEVSTIVPSYFRDCFSWACKRDELFNECELNLVIIEGISYCRHCKETFKTTEYGKECPKCKGYDTYLVTGSQVEIKDIAIE